jgi:hypothetical protein
VCDSTGDCGAHIPTLLAKIPDEYKPIAALGIGALVLVFLALFHGLGLHWILFWQRRGERRLRVGQPRLVDASFLFGWSVFLMLVLHIVEILIWAFALNSAGLIVHAYDAIYFCANCYTTLGMGKVDVEEHWRLINSIIGISGLFTFAWTTSALVDVVASNRRLLDRLEEEREQEMRMRFALRKKQWDALRTERDAERAEKEKARNAAAGSSYIQRFKMWREEGKKVAELHKAELAELADLRRQERQNEKELEDKSTNRGPEDQNQD